MNARSIQSLLCLLAAFHSSLLAGFVYAAAPPATIAWHGVTEIAAGRGERGPWRQNDSRFDYVDDPAVAINDRGEIMVAWVDQVRKDVFFHRYSADGARRPGQPVNISRSPATFSWLPRIVVVSGAPDHVFILWQEIIFAGGSHGGDILFSRSQDGGMTFSEPINITDSIGGDGKGRINKDIWHNGSLDLAASADGGTLYAAWTEYDGQLWFSRSIDGGASFSRPRQVAGSSARPARGPSLALGPDRSLYLAWTVGEDAAADIHVASSADGGATFSEPRIVAPSKSYSDAPKLAVDPGGTLHLVYAESSGGPFERYHIRYTQSRDGGRSFDMPRDISSPAPRAIVSSAFPSLSIDAKSNLYAVWELFPDIRRHSRGLGFAVSRDGGKSFTPPALVPGSIDPAGGLNGSHQGLLMKKLAVNGAGAVVVANSSLKQDEYSRVWLIRGRLPPADGRQEQK